MRFASNPKPFDPLCHYRIPISYYLCFFVSGLGKLTVADAEPALAFCTHLIYGYADINAESNKVESLNPSLDLDQGKGHYRIITQLKRKFPQLKVLLSIGGSAKSTEKYLALLESSAARIAFINSAYSLVKTYDFDGLDLAWEFPPNKPKKIRSSIGSFWSGLKKTVGISSGPVDEKAEEHKEEFTALVRELKNAFRHDNYLVSLTINPNVNSTSKSKEWQREALNKFFCFLFIVFFDIPAIINNLDFVILPSFDFQTPARNPKEADFPAPLYEPSDRIPESNINAQVLLWLGQHAPASKLIVGIPAFGRTWKLEEGATQTGVPPVHDIESPGAEGIQTKTPGLLSYPEICSKLPNPSNNNLKGEDAPLRKVGDPTKRFGTYAFRLPDADGNHGLWVGYEDPDTAGNKAAYVRAKGLGGFALFDISMDDFRGTCSGDKYPILRAAKYRL